MIRRATPHAAKTEPMRLIKAVYSIYAVVTFVLLMLMVFPFVLLSTLFGRIRGGNLIFRICSFWGDCWFPIIFVFHRKIYEAPHDKSRQYIFVSNHISYLDSAVLVKAFRQPVRALGKIEMARIPIFGFIYRNAIVTVDRSSPEHRAHSIRVLKSIISKGISVIVFPEGTFNTTHRPLKDFYDGAFRLAIETQTPIKPVLFLDTYDRMPYYNFFGATSGKSRIVYLPEISVAGLGLSDTEQLKQTVFRAMETRLLAYGCTWIKPQSDRQE